MSRLGEPNHKLVCGLARYSLEIGQLMISLDPAEHSHHSVQGESVRQRHDLEGCDLVFESLRFLIHYGSSSLNPSVILSRIRDRPVSSSCASRNTHLMSDSDLILDEQRDDPSTLSVFILLAENEPSNSRWEPYHGSR